MPDITALTDLMAALRNPETGCPWDQKQTSESITKYTLEEIYELVNAITSNKPEQIKEELGDLLFHVVFHSRIAEENGQFNFNDVIDSIVEKMTRRHPHVFGEQPNQSMNEEELLAQWQHLKQSEQKETRTLDDIAHKLPAMIAAQKLQDEAARYYFDWPQTESVLDKIEEEIAELREALQLGEREHIQSEMGDILFACVNLARHVDIDAETALRQTNEKFIRRFEFVKQQMQQANIAFSPQQLEQMEQFWQQSKQVTG